MSIGNEWRTPPSVFNYWNSIYNFKLDAAATADNALCESFCSKEPGHSDGLKTGWAEFLQPGEYAWLNMPFSGPLEWVRKAIKEQSRGYGSVLCMNCDFSTKAQRLALDNAQAGFFTVAQWEDGKYYNGRISFNRPDGTSAGSNRTSQIFYVLDPYGQSPIQLKPIPVLEIQPEKREHQHKVQPQDKE